MEAANTDSEKIAVLFSPNQTVPQVRELLTTSPAVANARDRFNSSGLHWAAIRGRADIAAVLIEFGADVNAQNDQGVSPLSVAVKAGHVAVVEVLLDTDTCDVNAASPRTAFSALHEACARVSDSNNGNKVAIVQLLLSRGASYEACDARGRLPIDMVPKTSPLRAEVKQAIEDEIVRREGTPEEKTTMGVVFDTTKQFMYDYLMVHVELADPLKLNRDLWGGVWSLVVPSEPDKEPELEDISSPGRSRY